ncbi:MAG TPA: ClbS/DfsB family four-helix bundle protein [Patescibacteria group bacterium]|nr:ClbS/DfsB family four-helix bundle protein [Patescibacteria group bacterium]
MEAKHDIIQATEQEYAKLRAAVHGLGEAQIREVWLGTWGVREIVAHIAGWHREMTPALERVARGEPPYAQGTYDDFDRWNARFVETRKDVPTDDLLREVDLSHREFLREVARLSDETLAAGQVARGLVDGVGANHYREHAAQIVQWRARAAR